MFEYNKKRLGGIAKIHLLPYRAALWLLLVLTVGGGAQSQLCAEMPVGDYGAVAIDLEAGAEYSSNIALNSLEQEDTVFNFKPLLRYRFDAGALWIEAYAGVNIIRYQDYDENDAEDFKSQFVFEFPSEAGRYEKRYDLRLALGYNEITSANSAVQSIAAVNVINADLTGRYYYSDRSYFRSGLLYYSRESDSAGYFDFDEFAIPVELFYEATESLSYGVGYRYRMTNIDSPAPEADSTDHAIYLAVVGEMDPSVTGEVRVGVQSRDFEASIYDSETAFFLDSSLLWQLSDLTWMKISLGNEFGTTISNQSKEVLFARFKLRHSFTEQWDGTLELGYEELDYSKITGNREDDQQTIEIGAIYTLIEDRLQMEGNLGFRDRNSNESFSDYQESHVRISVSYLF